MSKTTLQALMLAVVSAAAVAGGIMLWNMGDQQAAGQKAGDGQSSVVVSKKGKKTGQALIGGPFTLTDQTGATRTEKDLLGSYTVISFGFTNCPDVCPTTLQTISEALEAIGPAAAKIQPVFVTVDPERDDVKRLKTYHDAFDKRFMMLTGSAAAIAKIAKAYRVGYKKMKPAKDGSYQVNHTALIYLMGPKGEFVTYYPYNVTPKKLAEGLRKWVKQGS